MRLGKLSDSTTPCHDVLVLLLRCGLRVLTLLALLTVVLNWPLELLLAYFGLVLITGIGAGIETWGRGHPRRPDSYTAVPVDTDQSDTPPKGQ